MSRQAIVLVFGKPRPLGRATARGRLKQEISIAVVSAAESPKEHYGSPLRGVVSSAGH